MIKRAVPLRLVARTLGLVALVLSVGACAPASESARSQLASLLEDSYGAREVDCADTIAGDYRPGTCSVIMVASPLDAWTKDLEGRLREAELIGEGSSWLCGPPSDQAPAVHLICSVDFDAALRDAGVDSILVAVDNDPAAISAIKETNDYPEEYDVVLFVKDVSE